jgi:hypothetical protein
VVPTVAASVDLVVHLGTDHRGVRRLREIVAVTGRAEGDVIETSDIFVLREGNLGPIRAGLIGKGLIYAPEYGMAAFTVPGMAEFIQRQTED